MARKETKDTSVKVRLTTAGQAKAQQLAELTGCTVSEVIRRLVDDARIVVRPPLVEVDGVSNQNRAVLQDVDAVLA